MRNSNEFIMVIHNTYFFFIQFTLRRNRISLNFVPALLPTELSYNTPSTDPRLSGDLI